MIYDVVIVGGGQSALACAYYLRRTSLDYIILDANKNCGGSWGQNWEHLDLFSAAQHSSLPGWLMPKTKNEYPTKEETIAYLCQYEKRYDLRSFVRLLRMDSKILKSWDFTVITVYKCSVLQSKMFCFTM